MANALFLVKFTPLITNPSKALRELLIDHTDRIIEGAVLQLQKEDVGFVNQLLDHAKKHPEDAHVVQMIMQALDASENGIEMHISYE
jgi:hypothetical protein